MIKLQDSAATAAAAKAKKTDEPQPDDENEQNGEQDESEEDSSAQVAGESSKTDVPKSASPKKNKKSDLDINEQVKQDENSDEPTQTEVSLQSLYTIKCDNNLKISLQESTTKSARKRTVRKD